MFFDFQTKTPVSIILYACLYSNSMICVDKPMESLKAQLSVNFHKFVKVTYSHAGSDAMCSNHFQNLSELDAKV